MIGVVTPAKADTIVENYTVSGTAVENQSGHSGITSSQFSDFNTALGTLTGVTVSFNGTANYSGSITPDFAMFTDITTASDVHEVIVLGSGTGAGSGSFSIAASGTDSFGPDFSYFEGSGRQALVFDFAISGGTVSMSSQSGTLTYDYTPASTVTSVPEANSLSLLAAGLAGLLFLGRFRVPRPKRRLA
jgi:hypothetical protein